MLWNLVSIRRERFRTLHLLGPFVSELIAHGIVRSTSASAAFTLKKCVKFSVMKLGVELSVDELKRFTLSAATCSGS